MEDQFQLLFFRKDFPLLIPFRTEFKPPTNMDYRTFWVHISLSSSAAAAFVRSPGRELGCRLSVPRLPYLLQLMLPLSVSHLFLLFLSTASSVSRSQTRFLLLSGINVRTPMFELFVRILNCELTPLALVCVLSARAISRDFILPSVARNVLARTFELHCRNFSDFLLLVV